MERILDTMKNGAPKYCEKVERKTKVVSNSRKKVDDGTYAGASSGGGR